MPITIHSKRLDRIYRAYLVGEICDREFSRKVDELVLQHTAKPAFKMDTAVLTGGSR